ncbi:MAG: amino acid ABC transporter substrate-binding protein [Thermaerobacter sp.]|nr:amino acid ABC transporter substrate-binding protein [Thermaerobacter sp.]
MSSVRRHRAVLVALTASTLLLAACGSTTKTASTSPKQPITIGVSISLSGMFSGDGKADLQGYQLWADQVNTNGGLLGRPVKLIVKNDDSSTQQTLTNYQTLIGTDHVDLVVGPFSSLLTIPAEQIAKRFGYVLLAPAGGAPAVFQQHYNGYADVEPAAVVNELVSLGDMIKTMPASQRPRTVAYATSNNPFTEPQLPPLQQELTSAGVHTVYYQVFQDQTPDLTPEALAIVNTHADAVVLGTTSVPQVQAFVQTFIQQHYSPKLIVATSGPDQGSTFSSAIGAANTEGFLVPNSWTPTLKTFENSQFVTAYLHTYGGKAVDIPSDAAQAFSVGQVLQQLVTTTHSIKNSVLITALHGHTYKTVQGDMSWNSDGVPSGNGMFLMQWQNGGTKIVWPLSYAQSRFEYPKPTW